jgi:hypothetical protein
VESRQTNSRRKTTFHLIVIGLLTILLSGCDSNPDRTVIQLHFKSGEQVKDLLGYLLGEQVSYQVIGNTVVFDANKKEIEPALKILENIDQPPVSYRVTVLPSNIRRYSTQATPRVFYLVEGKTSTTDFNRLRLRMTLNRANNHQSLLHILSKNKNGEVSENHWLLPHGKQNNPDPRIFPKGITIQVQK